MRGISERLRQQNSRYRTAYVLTVSGGLVLAALAGVAPALPASAATSVTGGPVTPSPNTAGAGTATYKIVFTTSASGALPGGASITLLAPNGTAFPSNATDYAVTAGSGAATVASVATSDTNGPGQAQASNTPNQTVITLGSSTIGASDQISVTVTPISNPIKASGNYVIDESTSADTAVASSSPYSITAAPPSSVLVTQGNNQSAQTGAPFPVKLGVTVYDVFGNPAPGASVTFTAPSSTPILGPASGTFDHAAGSVCQNPSSQTNICVLTSNASGAAVASTFTANNTAGTYNVTASAPGTPSATFTLTNTTGPPPPPPTQVTPGKVTPNPSSAGASGATYTITFTTSASGAIGNGGSITFVAPNGTGFSSSAGDYAVTAASGTAAVGLAATSDVQGPGANTTSTTPNKVVITLATSSITASDAVTVTISKGTSGVTNPTVAASNYVIDESTSVDTNAVPTSTYQITAANPASVTAVSGGGQSVFIGQPFPNPLVGLVKDQFGNPVSGAQLTFNAPSSGASATFTNTTIHETDPTDAQGEATTSTLTANNTAGTYAVQASVTAFATPPAQFSLTNRLPANSMSIVAGNNQQAPEFRPFETSLEVKVIDSTGSPVSGVSVSFSGPASGPSGLFDICAAGNPTDYQCIVTTDASGDATAATLFANATPGSFQVTASAAGVANQTFNLRNLAGYWLVASDGGIFNFGDAAFYGSTGAKHLNAPIVGMAETSDGGGYWLVASDGGIFTFGDASFFGSTGSQRLNKPIVGMAATPDGAGYWLVASDGGIFNFGDAGFLGSTGAQHLNAPVVGMATTPDGAGYWLVASDGGIFTFGDAPYLGSEGSQPLNKPVVGMAATLDGAGYWLVASDGGIFNFGDAGFGGSTGARHLNAPIVGMAATPDSGGYWLVASDGGIFNFGDAPFYGSTGSQVLNKPIVGMSGL